MCECNLSQCPRPTNREVKGHPHAELMMQYAQDAMEHKSPELLWEYRTCSGQNWKQCIDCPTWQPAYQYRRKPQTIYINGYAVPKPVASIPTEYTWLWVTALIGKPIRLSDYIKNNMYPEDDPCEAVLSLVNRGVLHTTREAAQLHARALLSFTRGNEE